MIIEFPPIKNDILIPLFKSNQFLYILTKTVLNDRLGKVLADYIDDPKVALLSYKVFEIIAGDHEIEAAIELLKYVTENRLLIFPNEEWTKIASEKLDLTPYPRIKFSSEKLSIKHIEMLLERDLPDGFSLQKIDIETVYNFNPKLSPAFLPFFESPEAMVNRGLGFCIKEEEKVICVAAAGMPIYDDEFEVQVFTDDEPKYRRKGFATIASAALIKESLEKGITPHWDADNEISARLALKLGFTDPIHYNAYICTRNLIKEEK
ncbi:MAG TPA: GNAT family N-acetyltransferase [candidate division Zixibacteria bacterium]|nr:GNAT family N-acetyltransferase [candidate division Zixibacteria bacterium]